MKHVCSNCRHNEFTWDVDPCDTCIKHITWEHKEYASVQEMKRRIKKVWNLEI